MSLSASAQPSPEQAERRFFLYMAIAIALTFVLGFGSFAMRGMVIRPVPAHVHLHAGIFIAWVVMFVVQSSLITAGQVRLHRTLGWVTLLLVPAIIVAGLNAQIEAVRLLRVPPIFSPSIFLALGSLQTAAFTALVAAAIILRKRSDWHRRLMVGSILVIMDTALARLLPMPVFGPFGGLIVMGILMLYVVVAMIFDLRRRGRIHPAWFVVLGALALIGLGTGPLGMTPIYIEWAQSLRP